MKQLSMSPGAIRARKYYWENREKVKEERKVRYYHLQAMGICPRCGGVSNLGVYCKKCIKNYQDIYHRGRSGD